MSLFGGVGWICVYASRVSLFVLALRTVHGVITLSADFYERSTEAVKVFTFQDADDCQQNTGSRGVSKKFRHFYVVLRSRSEGPKNVMSAVQ